jgi:hypothetical protein
MRGVNSCNWDGRCLTVNRVSGSIRIEVERFNTAGLRREGILRIAILEDKTMEKSEPSKAVAIIDMAHGLPLILSAPYLLRQGLLSTQEGTPQ